VEDGVRVRAHVYPDRWGVSQAQTLEWMRAQGASADGLGKPLVFGEVGKRGEESERNRHLAAWLEVCARARGVSGAMVWSLYHEAYPNYDGFGLYPGREERTAKLLARWAVELS